MKKLLIALSLFVGMTTASFAHYYEGQTNTVDVLNSQGFSENTKIILDKVNYLNGGLYGNYKKVYTKKHADNKALKAYTYLKSYVDPIQDDGNFFEHQINFTNSWTNGKSNYTYPVETTNSINNL